MKAESRFAPSYTASVPRRSWGATRTVVADIFAAADIRLNGQPPWDIQVHDNRFHPRLFAHGSLGLGESYMDGWWDCDAIDEMCFRAIRAKLARHIRLDLRTILVAGARDVRRANAAQCAPPTDTPARATGGGIFAHAQNSATWGNWIGTTEDTENTEEANGGMSPCSPCPPWFKSF